MRFIKYPKVSKSHPNLKKTEILLVIQEAIKNMIALFLCLSTSIEPLYGQEIDIQKLTVKDGLSNGYVTCILQDKEGFMWIGTKDGLNRYDGYEFKSLFTESNFTVSAMVEGNEGNLWLHMMDL